MTEKSCCVTGHRHIPADKLNYVKQRLREEIEAAIADGYNSFLSGFAEGVDLLFAELVIEQKALHPHLFLEAALPYRSRIYAKTTLFQKCLAACNGIHAGQATYSRESYLARNRYMVNLCDRVIAVYDGRPQGGTFYTLCYAKKMEREIRDIRLCTEA